MNRKLHRVLCLIIKKLYNLIKKRDIEIKKLYNKKQREE